MGQTSSSCSRDDFRKYFRSEQAASRKTAVIQLDGYDRFTDKRWPVGKEWIMMHRKTALRRN